MPGNYCLTELKSREELSYLLNEMGLVGEAVEIGTHRAQFASPFLARWCGIRLYCIDPWDSQLPDYSDDPEEPIAGRDRDKDFTRASRKLSLFGDRCKILRMTSEQASVVYRWVDNSLDFVYIDGNHRREYVKKDIELWWPKVKPGGILAGHDITGSWAEEIAPVVEEFAGNKVIHVVKGICVREDDNPWGDWASWFIIK